MTLAKPDPEQECLVMATYLPLQRYRSILGFLRRTMAIQRQLAKSDGLIGYALDAKPLSKKFWTVSAWTDREHLMSFVAAQPHRSTMRAVKPLMDQPTFVSWASRVGQLPPAWRTVRERVVQLAPVDGAGST